MKIKKKTLESIILEETKKVLNLPPKKELTKEDKIFESYFEDNKQITEQNWDWTQTKSVQDTIKQAEKTAGEPGVVDRIKNYFKPKEKTSILDMPIADKCGFCLKPENMQSPECMEWFASEPGGMAGAMARCEQTPESPAYKSKRVRRGCAGLGSSGLIFFRKELKKIGVKSLRRKEGIKMLQILLNYVNPTLPGFNDANTGIISVDGMLGNNTRGAVQFFQEKTPGLKIDQCAGSSTVSALLRQYYKKHKGSNISYLYRDATRGKGTSIDSKGEILPTFGALPGQLRNQLKHVQKYLPQIEAPFVVVDDANRRLYVFSNKEAYPGSGPKLLAAMPTVTGLHKGDDDRKYGYEKFFEKYGLLKKWQRLKQKEEETDDPTDRINFQNKAFNAWLAFLNKKGGRVTASGISDITSIAKNTTKKDLLGYGEHIIYIEDPMNPDTSAAIHGTGIKSRLRQLNKAKKIMDKDPNNSKVQATIKKVGSYGCINLGPAGLRKLKSLITPTKSRLFVLPEDGQTILNYQDFLDFKKASDGAKDKYFKKLAMRGITGTSAADLLKAVDSSKIEQVDPDDQAGIDAALKKAGVGGPSWQDKEPD